MRSLQKSDLSGVACTAGPGLIGALLAGLVLQRTAWPAALGLPLIGVHHMEAHLLAPLLEGDSPEFPYLALLVSGGHSLLVDVRGYGDYRVLGESLDDAAGEAFDKGAKLLGLGYPGGPEIARLAEKGEPGRFTLPAPMRGRKELQFQFFRTQDRAALQSARTHGRQAAGRNRPRLAGAGAGNGDRRIAARPQRCGRWSDTGTAAWSWPAVWARTGGCARA